MHIWETVCRTEKIIKQKMQGYESFVAPLSAKRGDVKDKKELGLYLLPFKSYWGKTSIP